MSDPPQEEQFSYGYGNVQNFNQMNHQEQGNRQNNNYAQKRSYPDDFQSNRGGNSRGNYRGNFNNNRGNFNNNRGNYNNNRGNYNNNRGNYNYSRGGGYINRGGYNNQNKKFFKGQTGSVEFNPKDFYHPGMLKDPWESL